MKGEKLHRGHQWLSNEEDEALVKRYVDGDTLAFNPLFYKYKKIFFYNIYKWSQGKYDNETVEDMAMEFLGKISSKLHLYDSSKAKFSTWITKSMRHFSMEYAKRKGGKPIKNSMHIDDVVYDVPSEPSSFEELSHRGLVKRMISMLGTEDAKIFNEIFIQGLSQVEAADKLGLARNTIWYRVKKIREKLIQFKT